MSEQGRPETEAVLAGLKDFQRATVDKVFSRLYLDQDPASRFLVADEVGLGKTLVARGVIAKTIDQLWSSVDRIDVVYICSNADIAKQNINRLKVTGQDDFALASRITMLPLDISGLKQNRVNFISFTPGTSFNLRSSMGTMRERALLYWMLQHAWNLHGTAPLNVFQGRAGKDSFRRLVDSFSDREVYPIDDGLNDAFRDGILKRIAAQRKRGEPEIRERFDALCHSFRYNRPSIPNDEAVERSEVLGELRELLATSCLEALEPDLIILDEFQRFKHLLDGTDQASALARGLFEYPDARILLLSATPYKMYTLQHEAETDNHYEDFLRTVSFLEASTSQTHEFEGLLAEHRREILRLEGGDFSRLKALKAELEKRLRRVMVRTERLAVSEDRNGMLTQVPCRSLSLGSHDLAAWVGLSRVTDTLEQGDALEYWKAAPYLFNFMDGYKLKEKFEEAAEDGDLGLLLAEVLRARPELRLRWRDITNYRSIDPGNARLRSLLADTIDTGAWRLLWVPPALPYHRLSGPFAAAAERGFTKRLVFSSWRVVPKVIAGLVSYEAERRMISSFEDKPKNNTAARKARRPLLRFARSEGRLTGMPILSLIYPGAALAYLLDPLRMLKRLPAGDGPPSFEDLRERTRVEAARLIDLLPVKPKTGGPEDETWYWATPILLDLFAVADGGRTRDWLTQPDLALNWGGRDEDEDEEEAVDTRWADHVEEVRRLFAEDLILGPQPADLAEVVTGMGMAAPGITSLRALSRVVGGPDSLFDPDVRNAAGAAAWGFLSLFNLPEAMALIRGRDNREPYWRRVLEYGAEGCLQATLDEYVHILRESLGLLDKPAGETAREIAMALRSSLTLRTARLGVDDIRASARGVTVRPRGFRARFAVRYGQERGEDGGVSRAEQVRRAFNSPFWPFVLATTSVGQEGLDFHQYCHAIVHWNLPSNPVDLEQREGRIHRYKGHAVRRNVASEHGLAALDGHSDPWQTLFDSAIAGRPDQSTDLVPFWVYSRKGGATIERYVPAMPLSRDLERLATLRRSLAVYRMVFGQARQEELVEWLIENFPNEVIEQAVELLRVELGPMSGGIDTESTQETGS